MNEQDPYQPDKSADDGQGQQPQPYGQPYGQQPYGQQAYAQGPGFAPQAGPVAPKHPQAMTALVLGIVSLGGAVMCVLPIFCAPFAWYFGRKAVKDIDAHPGVYSGRNEAMTGMITGIIGTVLLVLAIVAVVVFIVVVSAVGLSDGGFSEPSVVKGTPT